MTSSQSDLNRLLEEARESRDQLEVILHGVTDGITVLNRDGNFVYSNITGARMCGFSSVEAFLKATTKEIMNAFEIFKENGEPFPENELPGRLALQGVKKPPEAIMRVRIKATDEEFWSIVNASPIFDQNGQVLYAISIFRDFTEHKRQTDLNHFIAKAASLLASSLDFRKVLSNVAALAVPQLADWCSIYILTEDGEIEHLTAAHKDPEKVQWAHEFTTKYPPDLSAPSGVGAVIRTGQSELTEIITDDILAANARSPEHLKDMKAIGLKSFMAVPFKLRDQVFGAIAFIITDTRRHLTKNDLVWAEELSQRAALAIENARLFESTQRANQMKDEFLATLSHELRTPLNVILGHSNLLLESSLTPEQRESIEAINRQAKIQTQIISDLLDISSIIKGKVQFEAHPISPIEVMRSIFESIKPIAEEKGIQLHLEIEEVGQINGDPTRLHQIVWNLLSNSMKFTPEGGHIYLRLKKERAVCLIEVQDTGSGIDPKFLPHIFERFRQQDSTITRKHGGLGLGLSIVRNLTKLHGGTIQVRSEGKNRGTTFQIRLPLLEKFSNAQPNQSSMSL